MKILSFLLPRWPSLFYLDLAIMKLLLFSFLFTLTARSGRTSEGESERDDRRQQSRLRQERRRNQTRIYGITSGVSFINVLLIGFVSLDPKSAKMTVK
jgi:hypothetical protein